MKQFRFFALSLCLLTLGACQTVEGIVEDIDSLQLPSLAMSESDTENLIYDGTCPRVEMVEELRSFNDFTDVSDPGEYNLVSRANLTRIDTACTYGKTSVTVDLKIAFEGLLGPRARTSETDRPYVTYPFFVAVTGPNGDILAKEVFAASMTYPPGENRQTYYENMRQIIPVETTSRGARYKILVGFQLNPDQLAYNRHRQKFSPMAIEATTEAMPTFRIEREPPPKRSGQPMDLR